MHLRLLQAETRCTLPGSADSGRREQERPGKNSFPMGRIRLPWVNREAAAQGRAGALATAHPPRPPLAAVTGLSPQATSWTTVQPSPLQQEQDQGRDVKGTCTTSQLNGTEQDSVQCPHRGEGRLGRQIYTWGVCAQTMGAATGRREQTEAVVGREGTHGVLDVRTEAGKGRRGSRAAHGCQNPTGRAAPF